MSSFCALATMISVGPSMIMYSLRSPGFGFRPSGMYTPLTVTAQLYHSVMLDVPSLCVALYLCPHPHARKRKQTADQGHKGDSVQLQAVTARWWMGQGYSSVQVQLPQRAEAEAEDHVCICVHECACV
jgi:hypothetical protein